MTFRRRSSGYTIIELMMALAIFAVGITGVAAMQKVTSVSNAHAKNLAIASHVAQSWLDGLTVDAYSWTQLDSTRTTNTQWLSAMTSPPAWVMPGPPTTTFGPGFDALGSFTATAADVAFCTHIRLSPLIATAGSQLIRTEVRVFWPVVGGGFAGDVCSATIEEVTTDTERFHTVYKSSAVRQTPGGS